MNSLKNAENITNKKVTNKVLPHIKVAAQSSIQFSQECLDAIGHVAGNYVFVGKIPSTGFVIASVPEEQAKDQGMGRPLNEGTTKFTNSSIANALGGYHSEWKVNTEEPVHQDEEGSVWAITETVNGEEKLAEIEAKKAEKKWTAEPGTEDDNIGEEASLEDFKDLEEIEEETTSSEVYTSEETFA